MYITLCNFCNIFVLGAKARHIPEGAPASHRGQQAGFGVSGRARLSQGEGSEENLPAEEEANVSSSSN